MHDVWLQLRDSEQAFLVEAVEQLCVNPDISTATMKALHDACERIKAATDFNRMHALVFVENKFLALYSRFDNLFTPNMFLEITRITFAVEEPKT